MTANRQEKRGCIEIAFLPYFNLLRYRKGYLFVWLAFVVSLIGDWMSEIACVTVINQLLPNSNISISLYIVIKAIPPVLLAPFVGIVADKYNKLRVMISTDLIRMIIVIGFIFVGSTKTSIYFIYVLTFLQSSVGAFFRPAQEALIPSLVAPDELVTANMIDNMTWSGMMIVGSAVGGALSYAFGILVNYMVDSASYALSALFVSCLLFMSTIYYQDPDIELKSINEEKLIKDENNSETTTDTITITDESTLIMDTNVDTTDTDTSTNTGEEVEISGKDESYVLHSDIQPTQKPENVEKEGTREILKRWIAYLVQNKHIIALVFAKASGTIVWGGIDMALITLSNTHKYINDSSSATLSVLYSTSGIGIFMLPFILKRCVHDESPTMNLRMLFGGLIANSVFSMLLGVSTSIFSVLCIINLIRSAATNLIWIYSSVLLQQLVDSKYLGRVISIDIGLSALGSTIAQISAGLIADELQWPSSTVMYLFSTIGLVLCGVWAAVFKIVSPKVMQEAT